MLQSIRQVVINKDIENKRGLCALLISVVNNDAV